MKRCFPDMVPRRKWKQSHRNVEVGDVCLLKYSSKFATPTFRLCRVASVAPDQEGLVRTCNVAMRPRRVGESGSRTYRYKEPTILTVGVQRLAVLLPAEEQENKKKGEAGSRSKEDKEFEVTEPGQKAPQDQAAGETGASLPVLEDARGQVEQEAAWDQEDEEVRPVGPVQGASQVGEARAGMESLRDVGARTRLRRMCRKS